MALRQMGGKMLDGSILVPTGLTCMTVKQIPNDTHPVLQNDAECDNWRKNLCVKVCGQRACRLAHTHVAATL